MSHASCMGGWCNKRDKCALYLKDDRRFPSERLCESGEFDAFIPMFASRPAGSWERSATTALAPATWVDALAV
jgi:hypothetical protein